MGELTEPRPNGRPESDIDVTQLYRLALQGCTITDVAQWFFVSERTVYRRLTEEPYASVWSRGQAEAKLSVRAALFRQKETNVAAAIFLGKNYCDMSDKVAHEHSGPGGGPIEVKSYSDLALEAAALIRNGVTLPADVMDGELIEDVDAGRTEGRQLPSVTAAPGLVGGEPPDNQALVEADRDIGVSTGQPPDGSTE